MTALAIAVVDVDADVYGVHIRVNDFSELAKIIAIIAIGQADHAATIIRELKPLTPAFSFAQLFEEARQQMDIAGKPIQAQHHRDGFLFECISWIAAQQGSSEHTYLKVPHIKATTQGMDGLMIELNSTKSKLVRSTVFEDKCTKNPRKKFTAEVMKTFREHHEHKRLRDLLSTAIALIKESGCGGAAATKAAEAIVDINCRSYRAALTVDASIKTAEHRSKLFSGFSSINGLKQEQRIGVVFIVDEPLRQWFQKLADAVVAALMELE